MKSIFLSIYVKTNIVQFSVLKTTTILSENQWSIKEECGTRHKKNKHSPGLTGGATLIIQTLLFDRNHFVRAAQVLTQANFSTVQGVDYEN